MIQPVQFVQGIAASTADLVMSYTKIIASTMKPAVENTMGKLEMSSKDDLKNTLMMLVYDQRHRI